MTLEGWRELMEYSTTSQLQLRNKTKHHAQHRKEPEPMLPIYEQLELQYAVLIEISPTARGH